ncbi:MAG: DUF2235 domain-containing protein [Oscillatoriales cyanobacterium RM2_1_1]|nr:DUF2235 domain-containing protein [Oscillatoriales cyanobacterium SM2_3_0]NJO47627.1 DUF2235 domain-containing protein [Oscillatoriales cyanobacterium RM2_1_1]
MKRLVVCCDGTWKKLDAPHPTNIVKIAQAVQPMDGNKIPQIVFYDEGIGTDGNLLDSLLGGAFGQGIDRNIQDAYRFLCFNYNPGDQIYLFGFSRGAYTVRSLAGMIYNSGLLSRSHIGLASIAYEFYRADAIKPNDPMMLDFRKQYCTWVDPSDYRIPLTLLGCWETVGSLGLPEVTLFQSFSKQFNQRYQFHDTSLSPIIQHALHGVAIDEPRQVFCLTPMHKSRHSETQVLHQIWFPGDHTSVGGGSGLLQGLSDGSLKWMMDSMRQLGLGLAFDPRAIANGFCPDPAIDFVSSWVGHLTQLGGSKLRELSDRFEDLDESVIQRWHQRQDYRPQNLIRKHGKHLEFLIPKS